MMMTMVIRMNDRFFLDRLAIAAKAYTKQMPEHENVIDDFLLYIFKNYGYTDYLKNLKSEQTS